MFKEEIKQLMDQYNLTNKDVCLLAQMSEKHFSQIVNGKVLISAEDSIKLSPIFGMDELYLYKFARTSAFDDSAYTKAEEIITKYLESTERYKLTSSLSLRSISKRVFPTYNINQYQSYLERTSANYRRFSDSPLAYFWAAVIEKHYCQLKSKGAFRRVDGIKVIPKVLNIMLTDEDIHKKINKTIKLLDANGIIMKAVPYLEGSGAHAIAIKRGKQHFVYVTDAGKREHKFIFNLIHELMHVYFGAEEQAVDKLVYMTIDKHIKDRNIDTKVSKELQLAFESFESKAENKWETLRKQTNLKINFGKFEDMIQGAY